MKYVMLNEYLKGNLYEMTKENERNLTEDLTNHVFSEWNEKLEVLTHICDLYGYLFRFYRDGRIVMEDTILKDTNCNWIGQNSCGHLEYNSLDEMLIDWLDELKKNEGKEQFDEEIKFIETITEHNRG